MHVIVESLFWLAVVTGCFDSKFAFKLIFKQKQSLETNEPFILHCFTFCYLGVCIQNSVAGNLVSGWMLVKFIFNQTQIFKMRLNEAYV